jgi:glycosyltransferase involved in cell wall biosynthesis
MKTSGWNKSLTVTVAICTYHRPDDLGKAMLSVKNQRCQPQEIIIVDNGCQDSIRKLVKSTLPEARYVVEKSPGLNFARNRAIYEANSEILAFLDDDAIADENWIHSILLAFHHSPVVALTGLIKPLELNNLAQLLFEKNGGFGRGYKRRIVPPKNYASTLQVLSVLIETFRIGSGCNMAFRTSILKRMNGFDLALDAGRPLPGGGDLDMFYRVMRSGQHIIYEPKAMVKHRHRRSMQTLSGQLAGHQRAVTALLVKTFINESFSGRISVGIFLLWRLIKPVVRIIRKTIGKDVLPAKILFHMLLSSWCGLGSYYASRRRVRQYQNAGCIE